MLLLIDRGDDWSRAAAAALAGEAERVCVESVREGLALPREGRACALVLGTPRDANQAVALEQIAALRANAVLVVAPADWLGANRDRVEAVADDAVASDVPAERIARRARWLLGLARRRHAEAESAVFASGTLAFLAGLPQGPPAALASEIASGLLLLPGVSGVSLELPGHAPVERGVPARAPTTASAIGAAQALELSGERLAVVPLGDTGARLSLRVGRTRPSAAEIDLLAHALAGPVGAALGQPSAAVPVAPRGTRASTRRAKLVGEIGHDIRNCLTVLRGRADILSIADVRGGPRQRSIGVLLDQCRRVEALVTELVDRARSPLAPKGERTLVDLAAFLKEVASAKEPWPGGIRVTVALSRAMVEIEVPAMTDALGLLFDVARAVAPPRSPLSVRLEGDADELVCTIQADAPPWPKWAALAEYLCEVKGLRAAAAVLDRHDGLLELGRNQAEGAVIRLWMPAALVRGVDRPFPGAHGEASRAS